MSSGSGRLEHALSFGGVADVYEAARPEYPASIAAWLVRQGQRHVLDVGAGTGKLTRALVAPGREVTAVDPSGEMLEILRSRVPDVRTEEGTGERLPLPDASVDAVTFAQAWHWVEPEATSVEVGRVLRRGGTLGLVWNYRDERVDWVSRLSEAMHADGDQYTGDMGDPRVFAPFGEPERVRHEWTQPLPRQGMLDLVRSRSYFAVMDAEQQAQTLASVTDLLDTHPQTAGREVIGLPYVTLAWRYVR
jgi:SAM-dependent methyltransferase